MRESRRSLGSKTALPTSMVTLCFMKEHEKIFTHQFKCHAPCVFRSGSCAMLCSEGTRRLQIGTRGNGFAAVVTKHVVWTSSKTKHAARPYLQSYTGLIYAILMTIFPRTLRLRMSAKASSTFEAEMPRYTFCILGLSCPLSTNRASSLKASRE